MQSKRKSLAVLPLLLGLYACAHDSGANTDASYDTLLLNGIIVDGTGAGRYLGDVALLDGRIAEIGDLDRQSAKEVVDIAGLILAPGFIDTHSHADWALNDKATASVTGILKQGVTTALYGVDGRTSLEKIKRHARLGEEGGMGINFMSHIGHNAIRRQVMGMDNRAPTSEELEQMKALVKKAMEFGTTGLSSGLMYQPGSFAATEELIELAKVTAPYGAVYDSHIRDPANRLLESHQECLDIAFAAGVEAHPGHVKAVGGNNFGKGPEFVALIEAAIARGQTVTVDLYPYDGAATSPIIGLLYPANDEAGRELWNRGMAMSRDSSPADIERFDADSQEYWIHIGDDPQLVAEAKINTETPPNGEYSWIETVGYQSMRIVVSSNPSREGQMVTELAAEMGITPFDLFRQIIIEEGGRAMVTLGAIQEEDVRIIMKQPWAMISSDGLELNPQHPRGRGTFPRLLGRYVRQWHVLSLEEAVHKITGLPARYLKQRERGTIRQGAIADLTVFDADNVIDKSTWNDPGLYAEGIVHVLIGGNFALQDGEVSDARYGKFIPYRVRN